MRFCIFRVEDMANPEQIVQCMQSHSTELDPLCRDFVQNATNRIKSLHDGCDADMATFCPNTPSFGPERKACVVTHLSDLSKQCLSAISALLIDMEKHHPHPGPHGPHGDAGFPWSGGDGGQGLPWGPGGGGPWGPGGDGPWNGGPGPGGRGHHFFGAMMGAGFAGGLLVVVAGVSLHLARRLVCGRGLGCRRGLCQQPAAAPPPSPQQQQQQQQYAAPQWQPYHLAQPVAAAEAGAAPAAGRPVALPGGGALYPAGPCGAEGYNRF